MATLSADTPTLHNLNSNSHSYPVDNQTEQGVLPTQNPTAEANGKDECVINLENDKNVNAKNAAILPMNIKIEPSLDIDDGIIMDGENSNPLCSPKIRLTPTSKLLATATPFKIAKKYACPYENCTKSYGKSSHLRSHLTWHTGIKPYVCQEPGCGKGFTRSDELNRHTRTHTGEKPFECVQCTKKFSRSDHLSKHLATHAKQHNNPTGANKSKPQPRPVIKIMQKPPVVRAPSVTKNPCVEGMHFLAALADHHTSTEPPEDLTEEAPLTMQPIKIKVEKNDSEDELEYVPFKEDVNNAYAKAKSPISPDLRCPVSPSMLVPEVRMEAVGQHDDDDGDEDEPDDDAIMPEANLPPYPQSIKASAALLNGPGLSQYDPIRPYKCPMCPKFFKRQDDLNRHVRCHTGEKPYVCSECDKAFKRTDHLKKHMNIHTRLR